MTGVRGVEVHLALKLLSHLDKLPPSKAKSFDATTMGMWQVYGGSYQTVCNALSRLSVEGYTQGTTVLIEGKNYSRFRKQVAWEITEEGKALLNEYRAL